MGEYYYSKCGGAWQLSRLPPKLIHAWITRQNVNDLLKSNGFVGEIDLFSLDMDGMDFWILKAIDCIQPRVIVLEYNNRLTAEQSCTVPCEDSFVTEGSAPNQPGYFGASLPAYVKLCKEKGYRLIGANSPNTNAFFIKNGIGEAYFPEVKVSSCLSSAYAKYQNKTKYPLIKDKPFVRI